MNGLVSIIVPVYNKERSIGYCVESLLNQTYSDIEIILIDDGSTDSGKNLVDKLATKDDRVRVFHTLNHGVSAARNVGLQNAQGKYLLFVDSDDYVDVNFVKQLTSVAQINKFIYQDFFMDYRGGANN